MTKEERRAYNRDYYARNRNQILEERKELYKTNQDYKEAIIENAKKWYKDNKVRSEERKKEYRSQKYVKDKISEYNSSYYKKNKASISKRRKAVRREVKTIVNKGGASDEI